MNIIDLSAEPEHIPTLAAWHHQEWAYLNPGGTLADRMNRMQGYLSKGLVPSTFVFKQDGQLAGSAALLASDMDTRPRLTPWLASVFVAPPFRRQGIGGELVRHVMSRAKLGGIETLYLFTPDQQAFYEKLGWQMLSREAYRGAVVTVMQARLQAR
ncbi:GNAT family N-acetyltransferase [Methylomonas methanica]|uniref:GCN5-related N-acetyltransferase n=1 Tax=Methylomonas methanica (strain DSM 25384 / MC09) TaxID=857087 RepID=F9ZYE3_METMM|nr:GNAT family N-acetyltransferase [Methylomonas methanica]AEG01048.1 GCN5-related N-acetyltransferase [Methylomonas methanica MC09]